MKTIRTFDRFDEEAAREGQSISHFRHEIGESIGRIGTPKSQTKIRQHRKRGGRMQPFRDGCKAGVWRGK